MYRVWLRSTDPPAGALLGAGGATAYFSGPESNSFMGQMLRSTFGSSNYGAGGPRSGNSAEMDSLYKLVCCSLIFHSTSPHTGVHALDLDAT